MFVGSIFQRNTSCILCCPLLSHVLVNTGIFLRSQYTCRAESKTTTKKSATEIRDIFPEELIREKRQQTGNWKSRQFRPSCLLVVDFQQALRLHKGPGFLLAQVHLHRHMVVIRRRSQIAPPPPHPVHVTAIVGEAPPLSLQSQYLKISLPLFVIRRWCEEESEAIVRDCQTRNDLQGFDF